MNDVVHEFKRGILAWRLWSLMGWLDIRQRYARSVLGPFWITLSMGVTVGSLGLVYGTLFGQPMNNYLPLVGDGFVVWALISGILNDSCAAFTNNANYIRQSEATLWVYIMQVVWRHIIMFAHNFLIVLVLIWVFGIPDIFSLVYFLPGLLILLLNLVWMANVFAVISARYRDVPQMVAALVQILFYITPLMWRPEMLHKHRWLLTINPFSALVDVVRSPLLGQAPQLSSWTTAGCMAVIGCGLMCLVSARNATKVAYWV